MILFKSDNLVPILESATLVVYRNGKDIRTEYPKAGDIFSLATAKEEVYYKVEQSLQGKCNLMVYVKRLESKSTQSNLGGE
jgi:hypothetical protein